MDLLQQSAQAWKEITEYRYLFIYGYKKQLYPINLTFSLEDYPHLAGFQYMKDLSLPNYSSVKVADRILEGKILFEKVQKAAQYEEFWEHTFYGFNKIFHHYLQVIYYRIGYMDLASSSDRA